MNDQFPQAPASPYAAYAYMQQRKRPEDMRDRLAQQIMGQPAQNVTQGVGQLAAGIGMGLREYMNRPTNQFPTAPQPVSSGGVANPATPKMEGMNLANLFGFGNRGWSF